MELQPLLGGIRGAMLLMCGSLDLTTPPALAVQVARAIQGAKYREIAGSIARRWRTRRRA